MSCKKFYILTCLYSFAFGLLAAILIFGINVINPLNIDYIYSFASDIPQHYSGWLFFRNTPWQFPIGLYNTLSYPDYVSVFWTDSIPILAIFFKLFAKILPSNFQYFGLFEMFNLGLQAFFGALLISKFARKSILGAISVVLASLLLSITPYLIGFSFVHSPCTAHWLILASFIPFVHLDKFSLRWLLFYYFFLGLISSGINIYIFGSCFIIALFFTFYLKLEKQNKLHYLSLAVFSLTALLNFYLMGVFNSRFECLNEEVAHFSFNLNGFFNHSGFSTTFLPGLPLFSNAQINFLSYLGMGVFLLCAVSFILLMTSLLKQKKIVFSNLIIVFIFLFFVSFIISLSPRITFGDLVVFEYNVPEFIEKIWIMFRATGRFVFISYYVLILGMIIYLLRKFTCEMSFAFILMAFVFQMCDFWPSFSEKYNRLNNIYSIRNNKIVQILNLNKNKIETIYMQPLIDVDGKDAMSLKIHPITYWASVQGVKLSDYYFARNLENRIEKFKIAILSPKDSDLFFFIPFSSNDFFNLLKISPIQNVYYIPRADIYIASLLSIPEFKAYKLDKNMVLKGKD